MNILITGTTSGIGLELAKLYSAKQHVKIILLGRKPLKELDGDLFNAKNYCQVDLTNSNCVNIVLDFLQEINVSQVSLLIHNAGIGYFGPTEDQTDKSITEVIKTNLYTPLRLTHALIPFLKRDKGKVVLISSVAVYLPTPDYVVYTASKAALDSFARNLRAEGDVRVQVIHPGATKTNMAVKSGLPLEKINASKWPSAAKVAKGIKCNIEANDLDAAISLTNKILRLLGHYFAWLLDSVFLWRKRKRSA